ncbi:hypothetical protein DY052_05935 [Apilactobacillus timberlakei]|uniref:hypothetical protein n=1 Tax=Apilactobacillus timberlakei TaxID=2008380 RepID=UPI001127CF06|nr:hypothetical protein [Apilactobacillus timberlakei]TPR14963.1 hypothetical protein DY052_05935 [Apilactobacillus timberlakei]
MPEKRKKYHEENLNDMLSELGIAKNSGSVKTIKDKKSLHPVNINDFTYSKLIRIKKEHSIFSRNIIGASVYLLHEILYGDDYKIVKKKGKP